MNDRRTEGLRSEILTLPNLISALRILLVPVFIAAVLGHRTRTALVVFFIAGISDLLDGFTARLFHIRTKLGMMLDPAGDKLLMTAAYILLTLPALSPLNTIPLALTILVFGRDILIVGGAIFAYLKWGEKTFPPSLLGKFSTAFQLGTVFLILLLNDLGERPRWMAVFYGITAGLTVASGGDYFLYGLKVMRLKKRERLTSPSDR